MCKIIYTNLDRIVILLSNKFIVVNYVSTNMRFDYYETEGHVFVPSWPCVYAWTQSRTYPQSSICMYPVAIKLRHDVACSIPKEYILVYPIKHIHGFICFMTSIPKEMGFFFIITLTAFIVQPCWKLTFHTYIKLDEQEKSISEIVSSS